MNRIFWPPRAQHVVRTIELPAPATLAPALVEQIGKVLMQVDALRSLQNCNQSDQHLTNGLKKSIVTCLAGFSAQLKDMDSSEAIGFIAEGLMGSTLYSTMGQSLAGLDECELGCHVGELSTWLGKSRKMFYSAFFGTPNVALQRVLDCVDEHFTEALQRIAETLGAPLHALPHCAYKIVDLFGVAGEANYFPKHFAYFMPEDQGIKYSPVKRTIVFTNTYRNLYEKIALEQAKFFNWKEFDLPALSEIERYLITWFRGHDLGHSIVLQNTSFGQLSKHDRWGSMVIQEALADVFGFLLSVDARIAEGIGLESTKMIRMYVLELLRYLRRGPRQFPDAGSAYIQLRILHDVGVISGTPTIGLSLDTERFVIVMRFIAQELINAGLAGDLAQFEHFIGKYCPHRIGGEEDDFMFGLGGCDITLGYAQQIFEGMINGVQ